MNKSVKPDCIINPATGRAVRLSGALGKKIMKENIKNNVAPVHDCVVNPATGRAVRKNTKLGKILTKELEQKPPVLLPPVTIFVEEINQPSPQPSPQPPPQPPSVQRQSSRVSSIQPMTSSSSTSSIRQDTYHKYSLNNRLKKYNDAKVYLDLIDSKECIRNISINGVSYMALSNKLILDKQIGTQSVYGAIYLSSIVNLPNLLVVSKLTNKARGNLKEAIIMEQLTNDLLRTKKTKHFPLIYTSHMCEDKNDKTSLVTVNELCNGDIKTLLANVNLYPISKHLLFNLLIQVFISLATYQSHFKSMHNDAHYGNFLYQENTEQGYYKYKINNNIFYLESCPYNIMLYDFGLSKEVKDEKLYIRDFYRIIHAFIPESQGGWNTVMEAGPLSASILKIKDGLKALTGRYSFTNILNLVLKQAPDNIFTNKANKVSKILNDEPYIIK